MVDARVTEAREPLAKRASSAAGARCRGEHRRRMREERDHHGSPPIVPGLTHDPRQNLLVAAMDAVEVAERGDRRSGNARYTPRGGG